MRVDCRITAVDKEAQFAKTAAVADKFINVGMCYRGTGTLEREVCQMPAERIFHCSCQRLNAFVFLKINRTGSA